MLRLYGAFILLLGATALAGPREVEREIQKIQRQARIQIQALASDPSAEAQRKVEQIKYETEVRILQLRLQQAEARGDLQAAEAYREALLGLQHPQKTWTTKPADPRPSSPVQSPAPPPHPEPTQP